MRDTVSRAMFHGLPRGKGEGNIFSFPISITEVCQAKRIRPGYLVSQPTVSKTPTQSSEGEGLNVEKLALGWPE